MTDVQGLELGWADQLRIFELRYEARQEIIYRIPVPSHIPLPVPWIRTCTAQIRCWSAITTSPYAVQRLPSQCMWR